MKKVIDKFGAAKGFEPMLAGDEPAVLPLHYAASPSITVEPLEGIIDKFLLL